MAFREVFIALVIGTALLVGAYVLNWYRPRLVTEQPTAELVRASGKCAECHSNLQYSIVHEYELSMHARKKSTVWSVINLRKGRNIRTIMGSSSLRA
jgi:hypothetical protein